MLNEQSPDQPKRIDCTLEDVTEQYLRRSVGVRFVVFLVQGKLFKLIADGKAGSAVDITCDKSKIPLASNKLAYGCMKIKRDNTFEVKTGPFVDALSISLPDLRPILLYRLREMGIEAE